MGQQNSLAVIDENSEVLDSKQVAISSDLGKVQQRAMEEYPYLKSVYESIVVTDPTLPDNPIIYCNDVFQRMTLYPREEIIGRNCRFLGGKYTSVTARRKITEALKEGKEIDVQLLNYRKDGTPFWNNFLLLPLHKKKYSKKITHFLGIQKDVTYFKQGRKDPSKWGPKEVSLFVTYFLSTKPSVPTLVNPADIIICNAINGARFLAASKEDWIKWGVENKAQRKALKEAASNLQLHKEDAIRILLNKGKEEEEDNLETEFFRSSPSPFRMFGKPSRIIDPLSPRQVTYWNQKPSLGVTCIKFFKDGEVQISNFAQDVTYDQVQRRVNEMFPETSKSDFKLKAKRLGGDSLLSSDEEFQDIKSVYKGRTLSLIVVGQELNYEQTEKEQCIAAH